MVHIGFPKIRGTILRVLMRRIIVYWGLSIPYNMKYKAIS